jgi:hypothetical protein
MAEALGSVASVITIVQTIAYVAMYIRSCKNAPQESQLLVRELSYVRGLLTTIKETIDEQESFNDTGSSITTLLNDENGLLPQKQLLDILDLRIGGPCREKGFTKVTQALKWPFKESETLRILNTVERYKGLFELALNNDHIRLSKAIRDDVKQLSSAVQEKRDELILNSQDMKALHISRQHVQEGDVKSAQQLQQLNQKTEGKC